MSDGMGRESAYLSSHATNRYFIPNWGLNKRSMSVHSEKQKSLSSKTLATEKTVHVRIFFLREHQIAP